MADALLAGSSAEPAARGRLASPFWTYWTASTVSGIGDAVTTVALPLTAVQLLGATSFEVSLVTAAGFAAWVVIGLPAGVIVHRLPLTGVQVAMDLLRAAALVSVPVAAYLHHLLLVQLIVVALVVGLATVVFDVGNATLLPQIVTRDELTARNSLMSATHAATQTGGPSLGGVLVQGFGAATSLLADVASYVLSAALLRRLPRPRPAPGSSEPQSVLGSIRDGLRFVIQHPVMRPCVLGATTVNFVCGGLLALTPVFLVRTLHTTAGLVGVMMATEGVGSLVGASVTPRLARRLGSARATLVAALVTAVTGLLMPLSTPGPGLVLFALGNAGFAGGVVVLSILWRTHRHTVTPPDLLARVMATVRFISWGVIPVGSLTAGAVATAVGNRMSLGLMTALAVAVPLVLFASRVRRLHDLADG